MSYRFSKRNKHSEGKTSSNVPLIKLTFFTCKASFEKKKGKKYSHYHKHVEVGDCFLPFVDLCDEIT